MKTYQVVTPSPLGPLYLTSDGDALTGAYFGKKEFEATCKAEVTPGEDLPLFRRVKQWLAAYFSGENPAIDFAISPEGTAFQHQVWKILTEIPYGQTVTYGEIAQRIALESGKEKMSAQAVGGAVGRNPISIIIPCHRVIGKSGSITGYGGGIARKLALFELEKISKDTYFVPKDLKEARKFIVETES
ncbi:methylated-DNA--[protein]-cysteine S-methyltransferase [Enterococcus sp. LJL98]